MKQTDLAYTQIQISSEALHGVATLVLFFICAFNDDMASCLSVFRSSMAFSNDTYGKTLSIVMSNTAEMLEDHSFLMPALLKRSTVLSTFVHSLHTLC